MLLDLNPELEVILLDDAYQHRKVKPLFSVLLTDYHNLFYNGFLLLLVGYVKDARGRTGRYCCSIKVSWRNSGGRDDAY